ncbi:MAG: DUF4297 family anti-phage-associated protein [Sulfitobacter sp.]
MNNRSANESIKGYSYQFDRTVVEILDCDDRDAKFVVEGVEDIDILQGDLSTFVQCKYYEGTEYNHSEIKPAIIAMLRHFHTLTAVKRGHVKYKLYGHFKSGQGKLKTHFDLDFMKKSFLSFKKDGALCVVYHELGLNDDELEHFKKSLDIDLHARTYEDQRSHLIFKLLIQEISSCTNVDDAQLFFYPSAVTAVQSLAIQPDINKRQITKAKFVQLINQKEVVFNLWLQASLDREKYAKVIKNNHFASGAIKRPKAARVFAIEVSSNFDLGNISEVLAKIAASFSHKEHIRTPQEDRYCPYVLLRGISETELVALKERLYLSGLLFDDGYPFRGSKFRPALLARDPTKESLYQLKLLGSEAEIVDVFDLIEGTTKKIYDFYINLRMPNTSLPSDSSFTSIRIDDPHFLTSIF